MSQSPDNSSLYRSSNGYLQVMEHYDRVLQGMSIPFESQFVDTHFGLTHVIICGNENGKPLVLWHGQNANATSWIHWFPFIAPKYSVYAVDVIGGMGKSAPSRPSKKGSAYGEWAAKVLEGLNLTHANMIGASQGGWLIVKLGKVAPEMICSAVLMSSAGFQRISLFQTLRMVPRILFKSPMEAAQATYDMVSAPDVPVDPFFLELFELMLRHFKSEAIVPVLSDKELAGLSAPTYLVVGEHEKTMNIWKVLDRALNKLPELHRAEIVPGVGHSMMHRKPDWVISRVMCFLDVYAA